MEELLKLALESCDVVVVQVRISVLRRWCEEEFDEDVDETGDEEDDR